MDSSSPPSFDFLHFALGGEAVLLPGLRLTTLPALLAASLFAVGVCIFERCLTALLNAHSFPLRRRTRRRVAVWRAVLYWLATACRLVYMLLAMTLNLPLILVAVTTLALCQLVVELWETRDSSDSPDAESYHLAPSPPLPNRSRAKSKPEAIFIHPLESNLVRADALAAQAREQRALDTRPAWDGGRAREAARALLQPKPVQDPERRPLYRVGDDSDDEGDA